MIRLARDVTRTWHLRCFDLLAGPPQALELSPVANVTEAESAVLLTVRNSWNMHACRLMYTIYCSRNIYVPRIYATSYHTECSSDRSMLFNSTQDHEVFAKHNKFGIFLVPQNFLNWNGPPDQHHTLDTPSRELKKLSNVERENKEAAEKASAEEKMKKEAKEEAKKARRERAKTRRAVVAVAAKEEEEEATAAAEIAIHFADSKKASKAESPVQIRPGFASGSALFFLGG